MIEQIEAASLLDMIRKMRELEATMAMNRCPNGISKESWRNLQAGLAAMAALCDATRVMMLVLPGGQEVVE